VYGTSQKFQTDPHWKDLILFYEYFNGDNGSGIGASHQTGWTGCVARLIQAYGFVTEELVQGVVNVSDVSTYGSGKSDTGWLET
jgi:hypothetical protein